uniref:Uncharacterized protein n=1 Tax=Anopheles coluzzii TaxID=1518534 RepID=A0A8W7PPZ0_ANOCL
MDGAVVVVVVGTVGCSSAFGLLLIGSPWMARYSAQNTPPPSQNFRGARASSSTRRSSSMRIDLPIRRPMLKRRTAVPPRTTTITSVWQVRLSSSVENSHGGNVYSTPVASVSLFKSEITPAASFCFRLRSGRVCTLASSDDDTAGFEPGSPRKMACDDEVEILFCTSSSFG